MFVLTYPLQFFSSVARELEGGVSTRHQVNLRGGTSGEALGRPPEDVRWGGHATDAPGGIEGGARELSFSTKFI
jgi:hypothetical protein